MAAMGRARLERLPGVSRGGPAPIRYVINNPLKEGKKLQNWPFVVPFVPDDAIRTAIEAAAARAAKTAAAHGGPR